MFGENLTRRNCEFVDLIMRNNHCTNREGARFLFEKNYFIKKYLIKNETIRANEKKYNNNFEMKIYFRFTIERHANEPLPVNDTCSPPISSICDQGLIRRWAEALSQSFQEHKTFFFKIRSVYWYDDEANNVC